MKNNDIHIFFRKDRDSKLIELIFSNRRVDDVILLTIIKSYVEADDGEFLFESTYASQEEFNNTMTRMERRLKSIGWHEDIDAALKCEYNTYIDGALMPCLIKQEIDSTEGIKFPVYVHATPLDSISLAYSGGKVRNLPVSRKLSAEVLNKLKEIDYATRSPFNFYLTKDDEIIVSDVMLLQVAYSIRTNILYDLANICKVVEPIEIPDAASLDNLTGHTESELNIIGENSMSTPGFAALHAYKFKAEPTNQVMVLGVEDNILTCIDPCFENGIITILQVNSDYINSPSDLINFKNSDKLNKPV